MNANVGDGGYGNARNDVNADISSKNILLQGSNAGGYTHTAYVNNSNSGNTCNRNYYSCYILETSTFTVS